MSNYFVGSKHGRWRVVAEPYQRKQSGKTTWFVPVVCDCGFESEVRRTALGKTSFCCRSCSKTTHGASLEGGRTYRIWAGMRQRCYDENCDAYPRYGGRGIKICDSWASFSNFLEDMGEAPEGLTIDRIDNDGDYTPSNCRWADRKEQNSNTCRNVYVNVGDKQVTVAEAARLKGIKESTAYCRYHKGLPI